MFLSAIHKIINSVWNKEGLSNQWKESVVVPIYEKGDKSDCNECRGMSLLSSSYTVFFSILLLRSMLRRN
jgi:hypothetical protein